MEGFVALFRDFDWRASLVALVDIVLVALIIYRVLLSIRGTRAAYMLVGLLALGGVFFVAQQLDLTTLRWLLDNVLNYLLLIVIIVFQADIRRGLLRMGRRMFSPVRENADSAAIEEIVQACDTMASKRVGALLVIEREFSLDELTDAGTMIDALVSRGLLQNIFAPWPDNPLHDGAAIIRENRIKRAATLLPLSTNLNLDRALGTRHRAAVGITEETDAVAVVVSEQRGSISICHQGVLHRNLSATALRRELLTRLCAEKGRGSGPFGWIGRWVGSSTNNERQASTK